MSDVFDMGGYGFYVWSSVLLGVAVFAWNLLAPALQRRAIEQRLAEGLDEEEAS
jgi:heme exporter protein CcmD